MLEWSVYNAFKFHKEKLCIDYKIYDGKFITVPCWKGPLGQENIKNFCNFSTFVGCFCVKIEKAHKTHTSLVPEYTYFVKNTWDI